jgi:hypothetical protein
MIDDTKKTDLSIFLKDAQKLLNMSNQDVSDILHCSPGQVSQIKNPLYWKMVPKSTWEFLDEWKKQRTDVISVMTPSPPIKEEDVKPIKPVAGVELKPYPVEHGIPMPARTSPFDYYQLDRLEVGDSISLPVVLDATPKQVYSRIDSAVSKFRKTHPERKFACRSIRDENVVRCWRIE